MSGQPHALGRYKAVLRRRRNEAREGLDLTRVNRRRSELWSISLLAACVLTTAVALFSVGQEILPESLQLHSVSRWVVLVLFGGLLLSLMLYVAEKEQTLRRVEKLLFDERIRSEALTQRMAETARLSRVGRAVNATLDLPEVLAMILDAALDLLGGDEASIMLLSQDQQTLEVVSYRGSEKSVLGSTIPVGTGISGTVAAAKEPRLLKQMLEPALLGFGHPQRRIHSAMSCPLIRHDELIGVLNITEIKGEREYGSNDLEAVGFFAEHVAIAIGNARLFATLFRSIRKSRVL